MVCPGCWSPRCGRGPRTITTTTTASSTSSSAGFGPVRRLFVVNDGDESYQRLVEIATPHARAVASLPGLRPRWHRSHGHHRAVVRRMEGRGTAALNPGSAAVIVGIAGLRPALVLVQVRWLAVLVTPLVTGLLATVVSMISVATGTSQFVWWVVLAALANLDTLRPWASRRRPCVDPWVVVASALVIVAAAYPLIDVGVRNVGLGRPLDLAAPQPVVLRRGRLRVPRHAEPRVPVLASGVPTVRPSRRWRRCGR